MKPIRLITTSGIGCRRALLTLAAALGLCAQIRAMPTSHSNGVHLSPGGTVSRCAPSTVCARFDPSGHPGDDHVAWDPGAAAKLGCEIETNSACLTFRAGWKEAHQRQLHRSHHSYLGLLAPAARGACGSGPVEDSVTVDVVGDDDNTGGGYKGDPADRRRRSAVPPSGRTPLISAVPGSRRRH